MGEQLGHSKLFLLSMKITVKLNSTANAVILYALREEKLIV